MPVVFSSGPAEVAVTLTENVQAPPVAIVPAVKLMLEEPGAAEIPPLPHTPERPLGVDTTSPAGSGSVNATPDSAIAALGLVMVKRSDVEPARPMEAAPKALEMEGGVATVTVAVAIPPVPPFAEVTGPVVLL